MEDFCEQVCDLPVFKNLVFKLLTDWIAKEVSDDKKRYELIEFIQEAKRVNKQSREDQGELNEINGRVVFVFSNAMTMFFTAIKEMDTEGNGLLTKFRKKLEEMEQTEDAVDENSFSAAISRVLQALTKNPPEDTEIMGHLSIKWNVDGFPLSENSTPGRVVCDSRSSSFESEGGPPPVVGDNIEGEDENKNFLGIGPRHPALPEDSGRGLMDSNCVCDLSICISYLQGCCSFFSDCGRGSRSPASENLIQPYNVEMLSGI